MLPVGSAQFMFVMFVNSAKVVFIAATNVSHGNSTEGEVQVAPIIRCNRAPDMVMVEGV